MSYSGHVRQPGFYLFLDVPSLRGAETERPAPPVDVMRVVDPDATPLSVQVATGCACFSPLARAEQVDRGPWPSQDDDEDPPPPTSRPSRLTEMGIGDEITTDGSAS